DGDGSDRPEMIPALLAPIEQGDADFVLGTRLLGERELGSLAPPPLRCALYRHVAVSGHPPRRSRPTRHAEMQMRVAAARLRATEVPVGQRRRAGGVSKVSGSWFGGAYAACVLLSTFA